MINDINTYNNILYHTECEINNENHECYGGSKNWIKIIHVDNQDYIVKYLKHYDSPEVGIYHLKKNTFISSLIQNNVIKLNDVYDLNEESFIININNYKSNMDIDNIAFLNKQQLRTNLSDIKTKDKISVLFSGWTINETIPINCSMDNEDTIYHNFPCEPINYMDWFNFEVKSFYYSYQLQNNNVDVNIKIIKINGVFYNYNYLKQNMAHIILFINNSTEYILLNNEYCYIGTSIEYMTNHSIQNDITKRIYLFNYISEPWRNKDNMDEYIKKIHKYKLEFDNPDMFIRWINILKKIINID